MLNKVALIGDSFGTMRCGLQGDVPAHRTWPRQVLTGIPSLNIEADFKPFRRLVDCVPIVREHQDASAIVIQAGIVDIYPRPFPHRFSKSMFFPCRLIRRIVRPCRREWINYVYSTSWTSPDELASTFAEIASLVPDADVIFITAAPLVPHNALQTPGAQEAILQFNDELREQCRARKRWSVLDLHASLISIGYQKYLSQQDSHLNQAGNDWLATKVIDVISELHSGNTSTAIASSEAA